MRPLSFAGVLGLVWALGASASALAQTSDVDVHRLHERLVRVRDGRASSSELGAIHTAYARRVARLEAELARAERVVSERGLGGVAAERLELARQAFEDGPLALLAALKRLAEAEAPEPDPAELEACLEALERLGEAEREELLSQEQEEAQPLPLRELELTPPSLTRDGPSTTASFALEAESAATTDAVTSVPEAVGELAEELDGVVAAYERVKNDTRFELYHGSMKGSVQTLFEGSGNDADINRLLTDLLRAEGVPSRYVRGVVRLTMSQAMGLFGVEEPNRVEQALRAALVPYEAVLVAGGVGAVELEHVWVEAYVPWSNYRGTGVDRQGRRWVPLDASFEFHTVDEGYRVLEEMSFDAESFVREAFGSAPGTDPLETLRSRVTAYLSASAPGVSYEDALRHLEQTPEVYGLLPASLPYEVISVNGVSFDFPEELEHRVRLIARRGGEVVLDRTLPLPRVMGRRLTLAYVPAEAEDMETSEAFGGLYRTPPFLVRVRPVLRSAGLTVATGGEIPPLGRQKIVSRAGAREGGFVHRRRAPGASRRRRNSPRVHRSAARSP